MRFWKIIARGIWVGVIGPILLPTVVIAGPLFPNVRASRSANGQYLVVVDETFEKPDAGVNHVLSSTYVILSSEPFGMPQTSSTFWSEFGWQVTLEGGASRPVSVPLISDDGQTIVLIDACPPMRGDQEVMLIYQRQGNAAKLFRTLRLSDVWTHEEIESNGDVLGGAPMWHVGGSLEFSSDSRELLYRSRWNDTVRIKLADDPKAFVPKPRPLEWK
jgi:hypothetical protein